MAGVIVCLCYMEQYEPSLAIMLEAFANVALRAISWRASCHVAMLPSCNVAFVLVQDDYSPHIASFMC